MHELKKYGAIGGGISLLLCWPLAVGQIGESVITDGMKQLNNSSVSGELVSYDRGYLSSKVTTQFSVTDPMLLEQLTTDGLPTEYTVVSEVKHGLVSLTSVSKIEDFNELPLTITTKTQLNGDTDFKVVLDQWSTVIEAEENAAVEVAKSTISGHLTTTGDMTFDFDVPLVNVQFHSGESVRLENWLGEGQGKYTGAFWLGSQSYQIKSLKALDLNDAVQFQMDNTSYVLNTSVDESTSRLDSKHAIAIESIKAPDATISDFALDVSFGDIDNQSLTELYDLYAHNSILSESDIEKAVPMVETLLEKGFYLAMERLELKVDDGQFKTHWKVAVPEGTTGIAHDPMQIVPALVGNMDTFVSDELVANYPFVRQTVDEGLVMEFVEQIQGGYGMKADLKDGKLIFSNGQEIPVFALLMPLLLQ
ncbi:DUF945 family protein [Vibrio sonorensis]|uniref:DUF945 family protein n=1 Tax=Vibrio sonorensis TaxID=1004316 RepID=UPI0008D93CC7|nr:DUF945 family protein [Vibrio sonorensis]